MKVMYKCDHISDNISCNRRNVDYWYGGKLKKKDEEKHVQCLLYYLRSLLTCNKLVLIPEPVGHHLLVCFSSLVFI